MGIEKKIREFRIREKVTGFSRVLSSAIFRTLKNTENQITISEHPFLEKNPKMPFQGISEGGNLLYRFQMQSFLDKFSSNVYKLYMVIIDCSR
jgi:hypothetical protein